MKPFYPTKPTTCTNPKALSLFFSLLILLCTLSVNAQDVLMGLTSDGGIEGKGTLYSIKTDTKAFNVIKNFANWGQYPKSDLVKGPDGALYGMTPEGGTYNYGTIFRMTTNGTITILKHFDLKPDGGAPRGSLILGKDGNFYGLTSNGGAYYGGVIFRYNPTTGQYTILKSFNGTPDGYSPQGHLVQAADGTFYGITNMGGANGYGTIFKYTLSNTFTVLKSLSAATDGGRSYGSLAFGSDSALYGMAYSGGKYNYGTVFRIVPATKSFSVIRHLNGTTDGGYPRGDLIRAKDGSLYGMTPDGGASYNGTIFKMNNSGTSFSVVKPMSASTFGGQPQGSLVQASDGSFYGTAYSLSGGYYGSVFKLTTGGSMSILKKFTRETDGSSLSGSLILGPDGLLYGMAFLGGKYNMGTIFRLTTSGASFSVLAHFNGAAEGNVPQEGLTIGKDSAYFGVTQYGGASGHGALYKVCGGVTTVVKSFNYNVDGGYPQGGLLRAKDGSLYGMTGTGGINGGGTIFKLSTSGSFSVLRHLSAATDGGSPQGTLIQGTDGYLYGTTYSGGPGYGGTAFKLKTDGSGFTVLRAFVQATDGNSTQAGLVQAKDGNYYGITGYNSRFFRITAAGQYSVVKTLDYTTQGHNPYGNLIVGTDGALYGTMNDGGTYNGGTIFKITTDGTVTVLRQLTKATDGANPKGSLVQGSDGAFYGTTSTGGTNGVGTIFRITTAKSFSVLRHLKMATDGGTPLGGLVIAPKITLAATAQSSLVTNEDVSKTITLAGTGATGLTFSIVTQPKNGTVSSGTGASRTYKPKANFNGVDSFAFTANLGCLSSAPAWVKIKVSAVNDAPVLDSIRSKTVVLGTTLSFTATAKDVDAGQTKTFSLVSPPSGATIGASSGVFSWKPTAVGTFSFTVKVTDNGSPVLSDQETITVSVTKATLAAAAQTGAIEARESTQEKTPATATLFPNPVTSGFTVAFGSSSKQVLVRIYDAKGSMLDVKRQTAAGQQFYVDASSLKAGQYFLQLQTESGTEVLRFVKL